MRSHRLRRGRPRKVRGALLTRADVAALFDVNVNTLKRWIREGTMPVGFPERVRREEDGARPGPNPDRWRLEDVEAWLGGSK